MFHIRSLCLRKSLLYKHRLRNYAINKKSFYRHCDFSTWYQSPSRVNTQNSFLSFLAVMLDGDTTPPVVTAVAAAPTRRTISPYDLSPSENPGCVISQPLLSGSNYDEWAANIRLALMARKNFGFVDGSIPQPSTDSEYVEDWHCNNALIVSWIKLTVEASLRNTLHVADVAKDLWEHIQKRFSVKNGAKIGRVKTDLAVARQSGRSIEAYYGYMTHLWTTLSDYRRPKICKCGTCTCNLAKEIETERHEDRVYEFLRGLIDSYSQIRSTLMSRTPFPTLDDVYLTLTQEEDSKVPFVGIDSRVEGVSFMAQSVTRPRNNTSERVKSWDEVWKHYGTCVQ